ncbi:MAG: hypothetical protein ACYC0V_01625 [Armatimonadota bacterium]
MKKIPLMSPRLVTPEFDAVCRAVYPNIDADPFNRRFLEFLIFSSWYESIAENLEIQDLLDEDEEYFVTRKLITRDLFWQMRKGLKGNISMHSRLLQFEIDMGINLNIKWGSVKNGTCTSFDAEIQPVIKQALWRNIMQPRKKKTIYFGTGKTASRKDIKRDFREAEERHARLVSELNAELEPGIPKTELLHLLNGRYAEYNSKRLSSAAAKVKEFLYTLPVSSGAWDSRGRTLLILDAIELNPWMLYVPSDRTARVHARGQNLNGLPKSVRKLMCAYMAGGHPEYCAEFDLAGAQLAIAAWNSKLPLLTEHLRKCIANGDSVWQTFLTYCGLGSKYKDLIKIVVYAMRYGMIEDNLRKKFLNGCVKGGRRVSGAADESKWEQFRKHPIIIELLSAREKEFVKIKSNKFCYDAFGNKMVFRNDKTPQENARSIMACVAQSWEQFIMYALIPVLERNPGIHVFSWLHDGITIFFSEPGKMKRQKQQVLDVVDEKTLMMSVLTRLEEEALKPGKSRDQIAISIAGHMYGEGIFVQNEA